MKGNNELDLNRARVQPEEYNKAKESNGRQGGTQRGDNNDSSWNLNKVQREMRS